MYDYQRFVSYIYAYENEAKSKNVGFAKAEVRNGICKIMINLKGAYSAGNERLDVSCFYQEHRILHKMFLGNFFLRSGTGEFHYSGSECDLASFQGLVIQGQENKQKLYLSMWEDSEISVRGFLEEEPAALSDPMVSERMEENLQAAELPFEEVPQEEIQEVQQMPEKQPEEERDWFFEERKGTPWEKLRVRFPKIVLSCVQEPMEVLRIEPQDIGLLPRENWIFGNNSFLLHGYYNYRYLILAKMGDTFLLGVPGKYGNNERFLARMFGFDSYLSNGESGYWYTEIKIGNN